MPGMPSEPGQDPQRVGRHARPESSEHEREDRWLGLCWKTRPLVEWAAGRPFAWVDDEITGADLDQWLRAA